MRSVLILVFGLLVSVANAGEATLATSSKDAYENSIVEMVKDRGKQAALELILRLGILAAASEGVPANQAIEHFKKHPDRFYPALSAYDGMTYDQIMAAKP